MHHPKMSNLSELPWTPWSSGTAHGGRDPGPGQEAGLGADAKEHTVNRSTHRIRIMALLLAIVAFPDPGDPMARLRALPAGSPPGTEPKAQAAAPAGSRKADTVLVNGAILVF